MVASKLLLLAMGAISLHRVQLPEKAKKVLDVTLPGWQLLNYAGVRDSVDLLSKYGFTNIYKCDLNGDGVEDYALALSVGRGECLVEYYVALIADADDYSFFLLSTSPASSGIAGRTQLHLKHKGEKVHNFDDLEQGTGEAKEIVLKTDAFELVPSDGCCPVVFLFEKGKFRMLTSGD